MTNTIDILKASAATSPALLAGAIAGEVRHHGHAEVTAIGAGAINQSMKAIAIARGYLAPVGIDLACVPSFVDVLVEGEERTGMRFQVVTR